MVFESAKCLYSKLFIKTRYGKKAVNVRQTVKHVDKHSPTCPHNFPLLSMTSGFRGSCCSAEPCVSGLWIYKGLTWHSQKILHGIPFPTFFENQHDIYVETQKSNNVFPAMNQSKKTTKSNQGKKNILEKSRLFGVQILVTITPWWSSWCSESSDLGPGQGWKHRKKPIALDDLRAMQTQEFPFKFCFNWSWP